MMMNTELINNEWSIMTCYDSDEDCDCVGDSDNDGGDVDKK